MEVCLSCFLFFFFFSWVFFRVSCSQAYVGGVFLFSVIRGCVHMCYKLCAFPTLATCAGAVVVCGVILGWRGSVYMHTPFKIYAHSILNPLVTCTREEK